MAFNLIITTPNKVRFSDLNSKCVKLDREYCTIFPIEKSEFIKIHGIGISINIRNNYEGFLINLQHFLLEMINHNYHIIELYNGKQISKLEEIKELFEYLK